MLLGRPTVSSLWRAQLEKVLARTSTDPPRDLAAIIREELKVDLTARYAGIQIPHPIGKASGQLSFTRQQVETSLDAGIGFVVLKTVIAEGPDGSRSMEEWSTTETRMNVERRPASDGRDGWTVTWFGRGWGGTLDDYLEFFSDVMQLPNDLGVPIVPSVKYNLPDDPRDVLDEEYGFTTSRLLEAWRSVGCGGPMVLEKDFSPTLAGDPRALSRDRILQWVENVTNWVHGAATEDVRLGVKLMNTMYDDDFQTEMVRRISEAGPAFLVVFNRLFDPDAGVAFGGWELSDRNLRVLDLVHRAGIRTLPLSATGNICSGRVMLEYALRGCENGQVHTFFQVPQTEYLATGGSRIARALHTLLLHPSDGLVVWLQDLHESGRIEPVNGEIRFLDAVGL